MSQPYTVRFALVEGVEDVDTLIFTASSSFAWVIRDVLAHIQLPSTAFYLQLKSGDRATALIAQPVTSASTIHLELRQRMEAGDQLIVYSTGAPWSIAVTGYQLVMA